MARVSIAILNHRMALELNANVMGAEMSAVDWNIMEHHVFMGPVISHGYDDYRRIFGFMKCGLMNS